MPGEVVYSDVKFAKKAKKGKEAHSLPQEDDVTYSQVRIGIAQCSPKAVEARSSQEDDVTYSGVRIGAAQRSPKAAEAQSPQEDDVTYSEVGIGSKPQKASEQRSKCTKRAALLVVIAVFVAAVVAIIFVSTAHKTQTKEKSEAQGQNTTNPAQTTVKNEALQPSPSPTTSAPPCTNYKFQCDKDWELHGEKCYYFSPNTIKSSWTESSKSCQSFSGNLVKIESTEEQIFLHNKLRGLMDEVEEDKFWIGLTDSETEDVWLWTDGSELNPSFAFWFHNEAQNKRHKEPDNWTGENPDGEDCVRMGERAEAFQLKCWFDQSCKKENRFICEKPASRSPNCT